MVSMCPLRFMCWKLSPQIHINGENKLSLKPANALKKKKGEKEKESERKKEETESGEEEEEREPKTIEPSQCSGQVALLALSIR